MSVFLAWMPGEDTIRALRGLCEAVATHARLAWRDDAQFHMTLRYLGETASDETLRALCARVAHVTTQHEPVDITLDRLERWRDDAILVARASPSAPLHALFADLERAVVACGCAAGSVLPLPHITLAYARRGECVNDIATNAARTPLPITATIGSVSLVHTVRGGYDSLAWWPLDDGAPRAVDPDPHPH